MDNILKSLSDSIGPQWFTVVVLLLCFYYAVIGGAKILSSIKGTTPEKRLSVQKLEMEILKIEYEIAALRKTHELSEIRVIESLARDIGGARHIPEKGMFDRIWKKGRPGQILVKGCAAALETFGFLCAGVILIALRQYAKRMTLSTEEIYVAAAVAAAGATAFYLLWRSISPVLKAHAAATHKMIFIISAGVAVTCTTAMWLRQSG